MISKYLTAVGSRVVCDFEDVDRAKTLAQAVGKKMSA